MKFTYIGVTLKVGMETGIVVLPVTHGPVGDPTDISNPGGIVTFSGLEVRETPVTVKERGVAETEPTTTGPKDKEETEGVTVGTTA
jgi:hypothetical protein